MERGVLKLGTLTVATIGSLGISEQCPVSSQLAVIFPLKLEMRVLIETLMA